MTMGPPSGPPMDGATADSLPSSAASTSEYAVPSHHAPIITPTTLRTDNSVTAASPIGDNSISPTSSPKYASTTHQHAVSRSDEHTSELTALMRNSYTASCLQKTT